MEHPFCNLFMRQLIYALIDIDSLHQPKENILECQSEIKVWFDHRLLCSLLYISHRAACTHLSPCPGFDLSPSFLCRSMTSRGRAGPRLAPARSEAAAWPPPGLTHVTCHQISLITSEDKSQSFSYFISDISPGSILQMRKPFNLINQLFGASQQFEALSSSRHWQWTVFFFSPGKESWSEILLN